jgi:hypothetical protein
MDRSGFVPLPLILSFPAVARTGAAAGTLANMLVASRDLDVDLGRGLVRRSGDWERWLPPDPQCPPPVAREGGEGDREEGRVKGKDAHADVRADAGSEETPSLAPTCDLTSDSGQSEES